MNIGSRDKKKTRGEACTIYKTITESAKELNITPVLDKIQDYRRNWMQHVNRMSLTTLSTIIQGVSRL